MVDLVAAARAVLDFHKSPVSVEARPPVTLR
jgi:hypothetical protein